MKKNKILSLIDIIKNTTDRITIEETYENGIYELLAKLQETAITIGNSIEEKYLSGGNNNIAKKAETVIHLLEEYCESVYQLSQSAGCDIFSMKRHLATARNTIRDIKTVVTFELPNDKKEVVFLPYKASMWDSLESIWRQADKDPGTEAIVIPIPYYDKNPDGSFRTMYYEGDKYPSYVPVTSYQTYDFGRHPDEIYIHNPYDDMNYVTSVHPFFYSKELKKYTDKLVYVPYFVLDDPKTPDDLNSIGYVSGFALTPAVFNADKVILQSESMKKAYITISNFAL